MSRPPKRLKLGQIPKAIFWCIEISLLSLAANFCIIFKHIGKTHLKYQNSAIVFLSWHLFFSLTVLNVLCQFWPCFCIISTPYESNEM